MSTRSKEDHKLQGEIVSKSESFDIAKEPEKSQSTPDEHDSTKASNPGKHKKIIPKLKLN